MENLEAKIRQSDIHSIINREKIEHINTDRPYPASTMAATAVVSPSMYTQPPPPYSSGWSGPSISGLISPPDSRRTSDNKQEPPPPIQTSQPHRQSLPSIHEALSSGPKPNPYASPVSASHSQSHQLPYSQGPPIPRSYPPSDHGLYPTQHAPPQPRQPSPPQPVHPQAVPFSRPEQGGFDFPRHPSLSSLQAPPAPHNPYAGPRLEPVRYEQDPRSQERAPNGYSPNPTSQQQYNYGPGPIPPSGQHPPVFNQPRYDSQDPREVNEPSKWMRDEKPEPPHLFRQGLKRHLEVYSFENNLAQINFASSAINSWSAHYNAIAQEQQQSINAIPDRMPTIDSVEDMIRHQAKLAEGLQQMKAMIHEQAAQNSAHQRMRELGLRGPGEYDDDMGMYGDDMKSHGGYGSEGKKRRGRAAPPGRCHSCNRAETPEWRRGPDGARTLCNACGLHYAKLTRKTAKNSQSSNGSNLRPKSMDDDDLSPRPM